MLLWCIAILTRHLEIYISKLGGMRHKKEYSVYALDNVDNSG